MKQPLVWGTIVAVLWAVFPVIQAMSTKEQLMDLRASYSSVRSQEKSILQSLGPREKAIIERAREAGSDRKLQEYPPRALEEEEEEEDAPITFAVVPKQLIEFFEPTRLGCIDQAKRLTLEQSKPVECLYIGPMDADDRALVQAVMVEELLWGPNATKVHGLAISVVDSELMTPIMDRAVNELKIPVVTFDSDAPESDRSYYIGTNNTFFGRQLARQMLSLNPSGGTFGIISGESTNLQDRANGILKELANQQSGLPSGSEQVWKQLPDSPFDALNNMTLALEKLEEWASGNPTVLLSVTGLPMRVTEIVDEETGEVTEFAPWQDFVDSNRHRDITFLCADASPHQLKFLEYDYVDGLAGQLPYDMGIKSMNSLWTLMHTPDAQLGDSPDSDFVGTKVTWHVAVPLNLPPITVDMNRVGNLQYVGYTLFGITAAVALGFAIWVFLHRTVRVVRVAQPTFLFMIALGVVVMEASMIPLGMDDLDSGGVCDPDEEDIGLGHHCQAICMGVPWLWSIGFTLVFSALFSKTWRINQAFRGTSSSSSRARLTETEMLIPFLVLMSINVCILAAWTAVDPLQYRREADIARDEWNRVIATYGVCKSDNSSAFLIPLLVVNAFVLILANWQAYEARNIQAEFAESKYIAICMFSMLQAMVSGVPVLFFVQDLPRAYYMVFVLLCFIIGMVILLVIFLPKVIFTHQFLLLSPEDQKQYLKDAVGKSTKKNPGVRPSGQTSSGFSRESALSDGGQGMIVRRKDGESMFPLPEHPPEHEVASGIAGDQNKEVKFERPVDVLKDRQTAGWGEMTLTQVLPDEPIHEEDGEDEEVDDIEGDIDGGDKVLPMKPFVRPVDVLRDNRETTGWGGATLSEVMNN